MYEIQGIERHITEILSSPNKKQILEEISDRFFEKINSSNRQSIYRQTEKDINQFAKDLQFLSYIRLKILIEKAHLKAAKINDARVFWEGNNFNSNEPHLNYTSTGSIDISDFSFKKEAYIKTFVDGLGFYSYEFKRFSILKFIAGLTILLVPGIYTGTQLPNLQDPLSSTSRITTQLGAPFFLLCSGIILILSLPLIWKSFPGTSGNSTQNEIKKNLAKYIKIEKLLEKHFWTKVYSKIPSLSKEREKRILELENKIIEKTNDFNLSQKQKVVTELTEDLSKSQCENLLTIGSEATKSIEQVKSSISNALRNSANEQQTAIKEVPHLKAQPELDEELESASVQIKSKL